MLWWIASPATTTTCAAASITWDWLRVAAAGTNRLGAVRTWVEPRVMCSRAGRGWSVLPPPPARPALRDWLAEGRPLPRDARS